MSIPEILKSVETEPEAAHLRNVLRRIQSIVVRENHPVLEEICAEALDRPATNGAVIDALVKENGDLRSEGGRLEERLRATKRDAVATHEKLRAQIDALKDDGWGLDREEVTGTYNPGPDEFTRVIFRSAQQLKETPSQYYRRVRDVERIATAMVALKDDPFAIDNQWPYDESIGRVICVEMAAQ